MQLGRASGRRLEPHAKAGAEAGAGAKHRNGALRRQRSLVHTKQLRRAGRPVAAAHGEADGDEVVEHPQPPAAKPERCA